MEVRYLFKRGYDIYIDNKIIKYPLFYRGMRLKPTISGDGIIKFIMPLKSIDLLPETQYGHQKKFEGVFQFKCFEFTANIIRVIECQWGSSSDYANVTMQALSSIFPLNY